MISLIIDNDILKVLVVFSVSPGSRFLRKELKEKTRLNNVNLDKAIQILVNSKIIKKERRFLSLNHEVSAVIMKIVADDYKHLKELPLAVYFSILNLSNYLQRFNDIHVYLFGSYAKLVYKEDSDIDILIVSDTFSKKNKSDINKLVNKTEKIYEKTIETHFFGKDFYKNKDDPLVRDVLRNGVRLI